MVSGGLSDLTKGWLVKGFHYRITDGPSWIMEQGVHFNDKHNDWQTARGSVKRCPSLMPILDGRCVCKTLLHLLDFKPLLCVSWRHVEQLCIYTTKTSIKKRRPVMLCTGLFSRRLTFISHLMFSDAVL